MPGADQSAHQAGREAGARAEAGTEGRSRRGHARASGVFGVMLRCIGCAAVGRGARGGRRRPGHAAAAAERAAAAGTRIGEARRERQAQRGNGCKQIRCATHGVVSPSSFACAEYGDRGGSRASHRHAVHADGRRIGAAAEAQVVGRRQMREHLQQVAGDGDLGDRLGDARRRGS